MNANRWSSRLGFIMAATGAAVGLGSVWMFPYMTGDNGGGAFVLVAILSIIVIGMPIMMGEILLGRLGRANPVHTLKKLAQQYNQNHNWQLLGWWGALALLLILSFYSVIAGWSIAYIFKALSGQLQQISSQQITILWENLLADPWQLLLWHSIFMFMTLWVVASGVQKGLERATKIMMPGLFIILIILMIYAAIIGDFSAAVKFLFWPDFSKLTPGVILNALGQAFFLLATGVGCMLVYGCYVPDNTRIGPNVCLIATLIILISLLTGLAIFPIVFSFGLSPEAGPGLIFKILPLAFNQMPFGSWFGPLFFVMLWFAAWTSSISLAEPLVTILIEHFNYTRKKSTLIIGLIAWLIGILCLLSYNLLANIQLFNKYNFFTLIADFATNIILPTGAFAFAIFAGWIIPDNSAREALGIRNIIIFKFWRFLIKYIAPAGILVIFVYNFV